MTTDKDFEDLPVWQKAVDLGAYMLTWTNQLVFRGKGDLANQLQRAALSISNNIAEGFERGHTSELLQFIYVSRGSAAEVRSMLCVMSRVADFVSLAPEIFALKEDCKSISRQLRGWANSLQNSDIQGQRHLNERSRRKFENKQRRDAFLKSQQEFRKDLEKRLEAKAAKRNEQPANPK